MKKIFVISRPVLFSFLSVFILLAVNFIGKGMVFSSFAQESSPDQSPAVSPWQTKIEQLKQKTRSLLDENDRYSQENAALTKELSFLRNNQSSGQNPLSKEQIKSEQEVNFWKNKISSLQEDNKLLSKELLVLKQKENLRNLQIEDLEYQKRQLVLGNKLQSQNSRKEQVNSRGAESAAYYNQLQDAVLRTEAQTGQFDLKRIQRQVKDLQGQRVSLNREINSLKSQNAAGIASAEKEYAQKKKVKRTLEAAIADLEKRNSSSRQSKSVTKVVSVSSSVLNSTDGQLEVELTDTLSRNRELLRQVGDMNKNISDLTQDIKNMKARAK